MRAAGRGRTTPKRRRNGCCYGDRCRDVVEHPAADLRPYGPKGALCCHPCGDATAERRATAAGMFAANVLAVQRGTAEPTPEVAHMIATGGLVIEDPS